MNGYLRIVAAIKAETRDLEPKDAGPILYEVALYCLAASGGLTESQAEHITRDVARVVNACEQPFGGKALTEPDIEPDIEEYELGGEG